ncbi:putative inositol monophosphatase 3 [Ctenocephalides felis]|uniref:putative inositol monophosphatase 3 n=1 Tax=Ctenocephalides felis TaxID=7515 RepID=UPI000E6E5697|nr:putative inositol monophosphatase 3 [Ctenocephalides felis]
MNLNGIKINRCGLLVIFVIAVMLLYYANLSSDGGNGKSNLTNIRQLIIGSVEAAVNGGKEVVLISETKNLDLKSKGKTREGANDPVTNADLRSHCVMYYGLNKMFPNIKIISEEKVSEAECPVKKPLELDSTLLHSDVHKLLDENVNTEDITVWIDPLDATQEFTESLYHYVTTMVCVAVRGKPIVGIIHFPFTQKTYWAWIGNTASDSLLDIKNKPVTEKTENAAPTFIVSRSHAGGVSNITKTAFGAQTKVIPAGGAGYKAIQVAQGNATVYIHTTVIKKWDICAGNAILNYLDGDMTTLVGDKIDYSSTSNPKNEGGLLAALKDHKMYVEQLKSRFK